MRTRRAGPDWESEPPYLLNITGSALHTALSLDMVNNIKGWSSDCLNASNTNKFEFAVQVIVIDTTTGEEFVGPWSDSVTVGAYCSQSLSLTIIIVTCVVVVIVVAVVVVLVCRVGHWWVIKKDFFDRLGKELDAKFVLASVDSLDVGGGINSQQQHAGGPEYELRQFDESKDDPGDTDTLLLRDSSPAPQPTRHKSASESAQSDFTTSGFGGSSSQGGCTTATLSSEGGTRLHLVGPASEAGSSVSGYISMIGRVGNKKPTKNVFFGVYLGVFKFFIFYENRYKQSLDAPKSILETEKTLQTLSSGQICKENQKTHKNPKNPKKQKNKKQQKKNKKT